MPVEKLRPSFTLTEDRIADLRGIVPEAFADGKILWDVLHDALGSYLEEDEQGAEHFGLSWPGKREARRLANMPSKGTLVPQPGLGIDEQNTRNIFIEGENLEVLKLLYKSYAGEVSLIYIDPPYNTGNDFIYKDDYSEPLETYLIRLGLVSEQGELLTSNTRADGRFHSNWLSMMYPRLLLAKHLLRTDGAIFVSIDDNEIHNLRSIMDEIFGAENFVGCVVRATGTTTGQDAQRFGSSFDYMLCYSRTDEFQLGGLPLTEKDRRRFNREDSKGRYSVLQLRKTGSADRREDRPNMYYGVIAPDGSKVFPVGPGGYESRWRVAKSTYEDWVKDDLIEWEMREDGYVPYVKYYLEGRSKRPSPLWTDLEGNKKGSIELKALFGRKVFDNPKPTDFLDRVLAIGMGPDGIVLDFFAGSCTLAHSVLRANQQDNGTRRFIMIQLPEPTDDPDLPTIADIGRQRIRQVITRMQEAAGKQEVLDPPDDLGFSCYRLTNSHFRQWQPYDGDGHGLQMLLDTMESPLVDSWRPQELLTEIMLLEGFPLDSEVHQLEDLNGSTIQRIASDSCAHSLVVSLDQMLDSATVRKLELGPRDVFICLDTALSDEDKLRLADRCNLKVI